MAVVAGLAALFAYPVVGQDEVDVEPSVWDLTLGAHATELPDEQFVEFACGTNGGPPSRPLDHWRDYHLCATEPETGWHEVYFQYDDEREYVARALLDETRAALYEHTSVYSRPVIATALFDSDGFMRGLRLVTDPRVNLAVREQAFTLGGFLKARYDGNWQCEDLPRRQGESPFRGIFIKERCTLLDEVEGIRRIIETHIYRRPGQFAVDPRDNLPTEGYFESKTEFEEFLVGDIEDREQRLAEIAVRPPEVEDPLVLRAQDCSGCDLSGANLKRADLRGANLAGADLSGVNLHAADLRGADLEGANLGQANLNRALLMQSDLVGADLNNAMLYEARLDGANLADANLVGIRAGQSRWIRADLSGANVADSDLSGVRMTSVIAPNVSFARSRLRAGVLSRSDFTGAVFVNADLFNAVMTNASLAGADMRVTDLFGADLRGSDFAGVDFSQARMTTAILAGANFEGAKVEEAIDFRAPLQ